MPKYLKIVKQIQDGIISGNYPDGFIPSEGTLCKDFDVSRITVRKALKLLEEKRFLISVPGKGWKIAKRSDYSEKQHVKNIACVCCSELPAYGIALNSLRESAEKTGYQLSMLFIDNSGIERIRGELSAEKSCGIICIGALASGFHQELGESGLPVVCVGYHHPDALDCICVDDYAGGWMAAKYLLSFGHKRFVIVNNNLETHSEFKKREEGFTTAMGSDCSFEVCALSGFSKALNSTSPSAVFMATDFYVSAILDAFEKNKIKVPQDISLVGYDNFVNNPAPPEIPIDSLEQPWGDIGKASFARLLEKIDSPGDCRKIQFRPTLVKKGSVVKI